MKKIEFSLTSNHHQRRFLIDASFIENGQSKPVIVFNHGFKGFKDWGPFNIVAERFASAGFVFVKMNFSHNGTTTDNPLEFADLEAFANNNFTMELDDTGVLLDHLFADECSIPSSEMDLSRLFQVGHSRGGAHVILKANEDKRIKSISTWAAVNNLEVWHTKEELDYWKSVGTIYIHNSRTGQDMPMHFQIVEDFIANKDRLQVPDAVRKLTIPIKAFHGKKDPTVAFKSAVEMKQWNPAIELELLDDADHTFGAGHPFAGSSLPTDLQYVVDETIEFFGRYST
jgi:pimeloyl-ACP methyl ester carboxylesterase